MDDSSLLLCYNKGCGERFDPTKNDENSCVHHPGAPVFHDAYKSWSCCSKKTTDFTDFLNIKGCSRSFHSNAKPQEVVKEKSAVSPDFEQSADRPVPNNIPPKPVERPSPTDPLVRLGFTVAASLKSEILKFKNKTNSEQTVSEDNKIVTVGTSCKNGGCTKGYSSEADNAETCMHHPGYPVFHEGMKYWTCCTRRTTDFENFLEQAGCTAGTHLWVKPKTANDIKTSCRHDWYQTGSNVYITIYAKMPIPEKSCIEMNNVKLHVFVVFGEDHNPFEMDVSLFGVVDVNCSSVQYALNKVEIKLKKSDAQKWPDLALKEVNATKSNVDSLENNLDDTLKL